MRAGRFLAVVAALLAQSSPVMAGESRATVKHFINKPSTNDYNILEGVALNATPTARTIEIDLASVAAGVEGEQFTKLDVKVFFTRSTADAVTAEFSCSSDGTKFAKKTTRACSAGSCTVYPQVDTRPVTSDDDFLLEYGVASCNKVQILFGGASAGALDLVDVQVAGMTGG